MTIIEQLQAFLNSSKTLGHRGWLEDNIMRVYLRRGLHKIDGHAKICLDIANVTVAEDERGKGHFSQFLDKARELNPWDGIYVECIQNELLEVFLLKRGWKPCGPMSHPTESYFLAKDAK